MRMPKLYLRDLFWLVLIVGMGLAWWMDHTRQTNRNLHLLRSSMLWETRTDGVIRRMFEIDPPREVLWNDDSFDAPPFQIVEPSGETYYPGPATPAEQRLSRLRAAIEAEGYRVTFKKAARQGHEQLSLERRND